MTYPVDLQLHSTYSDGTDSPAALIDIATDLGIQVLALTDHDSVLGVNEAMAAADGKGIRVVPALEFSTTNQPQRDLLDINILAYGIRHEDPGLLATMQRVIDSRVDQKIRQIKRLQAYGIDVPIDEVLASAVGVPGRVHIARTALQRNPDKFTSLNDVFAQYLATDAPNSTYVERSFSLSVDDAIELTHQAGGIAVLAHPGSYTRVQDINAAVRLMVGMGLDGIEVRYTYAQNRGHRGASDAAVDQVIAHFDTLADECGLLKTGGSDYHGTTKPDIEPGQKGLPLDEWSALCERLGW
jgi:predicted metal-dependent phosphoesterase TrpH